MRNELGRLVPVGGGDPIPLIMETMTVGRRQSCDICLDYHNVSGVHAEFEYRMGVWSVRDMGSTNGIKVNGERVPSRALRPGDQVAIAGHKFSIEYILADGIHIEDPNDDQDSILGKSLMEKAGLVKPKVDRRR